MAQVIVTFKVMPIGTETDLDKLQKEINASVNPEKINRESIAFGLVALIVTTLIEDAGGQLEIIENKLNAINGVGGVEVIEMTRTL